LDEWSLQELNERQGIFAQHIRLMDKLRSNPKEKGIADKIYNGCIVRCSTTTMHGIPDCNGIQRSVVKYDVSKVNGMMKEIDCLVAIPTPITELGKFLLFTFRCYRAHSIQIGPWGTSL
jgi:hypothetical protein